MVLLGDDLISVLGPLSFLAFLSEFSQAKRADNTQQLAGANDEPATAANERNLAANMRGAPPDLPGVLPGENPINIGGVAAGNVGCYHAARFRSSHSPNADEDVAQSTRLMGPAHVVPSVSEIAGFFRTYRVDLTSSHS